MSWKVVARKIGRAGNEKQRLAKQKEWDRKYGENNWETGYVIEGEFVSQDDAFETVYCESYRVHFDQHPQDLEELLNLAKKIRNPHAEATGGVDLQVPAILKIMEEKELSFVGNELVDIGCWQGQRSHPISERLSPLQIKYAFNPKMTLEKFWQSKKCLAVWD